MGGTKDPHGHRVTERKISTQEIKGTDESTAEPWCVTDTRQMFAAFALLPDPSVVSGRSSIYSVASATRFFFPAWQLLISVLATTLLLHLLTLPCLKRNLVSLHINSKYPLLISVLLGQHFSCLQIPNMGHDKIMRKGKEKEYPKRIWSERILLLLRDSLNDLQWTLIYYTLYLYIAIFLFGNAFLFLYVHRNLVTKNAVINSKSFLVYRMKKTPQSLQHILLTENKQMGMVKGKTE